MKYLILMVLSIASMFAFADGPSAKGLGFVAPQVKSNPTNSVANPHQGEIVFFDSSGTGTNGSFFGFSGSSWKKLMSAGDSGLYGMAVTDGSTDCNWLYTNSSWGGFPEITACPAATVTQNASAPSTKIPGVTFANLPAGSYQVYMSGVLASEADTVCTFRLSDGTNSSGYQFLVGPQSSGENYLGTIVGTFTYASAQSNITFQVQANRLAGPNHCKLVDGSVGNMRFELSVIRL